MQDLAPSADHGALERTLFKHDPLGQGHADPVINPTHGFPGNAYGDDVVDHRVNGSEEFDLKAAARFPGAAVAPANFAIDVGEAVPTMAIGKDEPGQSWAGFRDN